MSTPETTKLTIIGSELPTGSLISYGVDAATGLTSVFRCTAQGVITQQVLNPFPPSSFSEAGSVIKTLSLASVINRFEVLPRYSTLFYLVVTVDGAFIVTPVNSELRRAFNCTLVVLSLVYGSNAIMYAVGLGKSATGTLNYTIDVGTRFANGFYAGHKIINVDSTKCVSGSDGVMCYGQYIAPTNDLYVLLNPTAGYIMKTNMLDSSTTPVYSQLAIPASGIIRQFFSGHYLCSGSGSNLYLYSIADNGTFLTQLAPGTYDSTSPTEHVVVA